MVFGADKALLDGGNLQKILPPLCIGLAEVKSWRNSLSASYIPFEKSFLRKLANPSNIIPTILSLLLISWECRLNKQILSADQ